MAIAEVETHLIRVDIRDDVAYLTLDRPPLNVLSIAMMSQLVAAFDTATSKPSLRAIVLRGAGKTFCVGADIGEHQGETLRPLLDAFHTLILRLLQCPVPVVVGVHGYALGGGCELATAADIVVITEEALIGVPEITLGVLPPAAAVLFPRLIGAHRAFELILGGEPVSGVEAVRLGLANRAVPAEDLDEAVELVVGRFRTLSGAALRRARRAVIQSMDLPVEAALQHLEQLQLSEIIPSPDAQEGLRAFTEKRTPIWRHT